MTDTVEYTVFRGEDITLPFVVTQGNKDDVDEVTARLRRLGSGGRPLPETAIDLEVQDREASGDIPAGWNLILSSEVSGGLKIGRYYVTINVTIGDDSQQMQNAVLRVEEG